MMLYVKEATQSEAVDPKINIHTGLVINADELHESKVPSIKHSYVTYKGGGWRTAARFCKLRAEYLSSSFFLSN